MLRKLLLALGLALTFGVLLFGFKEFPVSAQTKLSGAEIVDKNVAARGGLQAWRSVQTMTMSGKMGAGGNRRPPAGAGLPAQYRGKATTPQPPAEEVQLPFLMDLKRPGKVRIEIQFNGQTAVQIFDGTNGWKLRPFLGRNDVEPYTPEEAKGAALASDLDGPLVDYAAKGNKVDLEAFEKVEGNDCYKLKVTTKNGAAIHVWIDAKTFLEAKIEGQPRMLDGVYHPVEVYYRDYRPVQGLQLPFLLETKIVPVKAGPRIPQPPPSEKTGIDRVAVNPKLDDALFTKASLQTPLQATAKK